jgi:hypothetical protein
MREDLSEKKFASRQIFCFQKSFDEKEIFIHVRLLFGHRVCGGRAKLS